MIPTKLVDQRRKKDCGIASLATLLGVSYDDANDAVIATLGRRLGAGVYVATLKRAAERLGRKLRLRRKFDWETARGIVGVTNERIAHFAVLLGDGVLFDPEDSTVWDYDDYLAVYEFTHFVLLVV